MCPPNPNLNHDPHVPAKVFWEPVALGPKQSKCPFIYECPREEDPNPIEGLCCGTTNAVKRSHLDAINASLIGRARIIDMLVQDVGIDYYLWIISSFRDGPIYRAACDFTGTRTHTFFLVWCVF